MADREALRRRVEELAERDWDDAAIKKRFDKLTREGIPRKHLDRAYILANKKEILDRVQRLGEENEYLSHSCAKGSALAVMEEFGLGNMEVIKALSPFPGLGMMGWVCGGVTGSLIALGLYFGSEDLLNYEGTGRTMTAARTFIPRFEEEVGTILCPKLQEDVVFGSYLDPKGSAVKFEVFKKSKGYEKCSLLPGIGARIAAEIIIEEMEKQGENTLLRL